MTLFDITDEFLQKELDKTRQFLKKGGPYPEFNRKKRRDEVFRLHFEHGISAVMISQMMKVNRHTISKDIEFWNERLGEEVNKMDLGSFAMKTVHRFEIQRTRLYKELENQNRVQDKIIYEKLISDIDSKIIQTVLKLVTTNYSIREISKNTINQILEEQHIPGHLFDMHHLQKVSVQTKEKIEKLIEADKESGLDFEVTDEDEEENEEVDEENITEDVKVIE